MPHQSSMPLTTLKRPRTGSGTRVSTHTFVLVKRPRASKVSPEESPDGENDAAVHYALTARYGPLAWHPLSKTKTVPPPPPRIEPPPTPSLAFDGLAFLTSSSNNNVDPLPSISLDVKCDVCPRNDVPLSMLYDNITPGK